MRRIVWSSEALDQLEEITAYVRGFSPQAAARLEQRFVKVANSLASLSERGRAIGGSLREIAIIQPYVLRYMVVDEEVTVLTIRHTARRPEA